MPAEPGAKEAANWFLYAQRDLESARLLFKAAGSTGNVAFFLQQTSEKYLKGFLISKGWKLQKIHDLEVLLSEAAKFGNTFKDFLEFGRLLSAAYVESRYPLGPPKEYPQQLIAEWFEQTEELMIKLIKRQP